MESKKIIELEYRLRRLEEDLNLAYDAVDERLSEIERQNKQNNTRLTWLSIAVTIIIGAVQIGIALYTVIK